LHTWEAKKISITKSHLIIIYKIAAVARCLMIMLKALHVVVFVLILNIAMFLLLFLMRGRKVVYFESGSWLLDLVWRRTLN
jgi:hypothetical protein